MSQHLFQRTRSNGILNDVERWLISAPPRYLLLKRHGAIGEYNSRSSARRPAAFEALAPEEEPHGQHDEGDAAEDAPDDRSCVLVVVVLGCEMSLVGC